MKSYTEKQHAELLVELEELDRIYDPMIINDPRLFLITEAIDQIKQKLTKYSFKNDEEEVYYFKHILPKTLSLYFYYKDKMDWDCIAVVGRDHARYTYHDRIFSQAENFRTDNKTFCDYCRDGKSELDYFYFSRKSHANREISYDVRQITDASAPPIHTELLAKYIAYTRLEFESKKIIEGYDKSLPPINSTVTRLKWTGKNIELNELGNALFETGSFNDGKATKKEIFDYLGKVFEVKLGNHNRVFHDVINRKGSSTAFLDLLKEKLIARIDEMLN